MADKVPVLHGQMITDPGWPEPEAQGASQSSRPKALSCCLFTLKWFCKKVACALGLLGILISASVAITSRAALEIITSTFLSAASNTSIKRRAYKLPDAPVMATQIRSLKIGRASCRERV